VANYRVQEFARLAGVTVRTLYHYDRLGLLMARRTSSRYRLYSDSDLERLEQIVTLQFLGIPLKQIGGLLDGMKQTRFPRSSTPPAPRTGGEAQPPRPRHSRGRTASCPRCAQTHHRGDRNAKQCRLDEEVSSEEAWAKIEHQREQWSPELQERVSREWAELFRDVAEALHEDPAEFQQQMAPFRNPKVWECIAPGNGVE
jgi:DNA-binding transcriptional MerR regulator